MPPAVGRGVLEVGVRPMADSQPGETVHPPRLSVGDTRPQPVADMRLQLGNRFVHVVTAGVGTFRRRTSCPTSPAPAPA